MHRDGLSLCLVLALLAPLPAYCQPASYANPHNGRYCLLCHLEQPRLGVDTRETVTFRGRGWDDPNLCLHCHKPEENLHPVLVDPVSEALQTAAPRNLPLGTSPGLEGKVVCATCHFLHAVDTRFALMRGFPGSQQPKLYKKWQDICEECHGAGLAKRSPHDGDERACFFCHGQKPDGTKPFTLTASAEPLCNFCHGSIQSKHAVGVSEISTPALCALCHDPHAEAGDQARQKPSFIELGRNRVTLDPHYKKSLCYTCHLDKQGEEHPLRYNDPVALCNRCHASGEIVGDIHPMMNLPPGMQIPADWPRGEDRMTCLTCHLVGHPEDDEELMLLRGGPYDDRRTFCYHCHPRDRDLERNPHIEINQDEGCGFCHSLRPDPKIDTSSSVKLIADVNLICIRCHDVGPHPANFRHTVIVKEERRNDIDKLFPIFNGRIVCATCHNPHVKESDDFKLRSSTRAFQICTECHPY